VPILQHAGRPPAWPEGVVGSITHCNNFACAVAARSDRYVSLGVDAEMVQRMEAGFAELICGPEELQHIATLQQLDDAEWPLIVFSAKEAIYKCISPLIEDPIEFTDVALRFPPDGGGSRRGNFVIDAGCTHSGLRHLPVSGAWLLAGTMVLCGAYIIAAVP
jgi:4'-phosphopantetheinyl transferase EntD